MGTNRNALNKLLHDVRKRLKGWMEAESLSAKDVLVVFAWAEILPARHASQWRYVDKYQNGGQAIDETIFKAMVQEIAGTHGREIGCDECFGELHRFVALRLAGLDTAGAIPPIQEHLHACGENTAKSERRCSLPCAPREKLI